MNRRKAIYNAVLLSAGTFLLPSCGQDDAASIPLKNMRLSGADEKLVLHIVDAILPATTFKGGADVKAVEFILNMVDDCCTPETQKIFLDGMQQLNKLTKSKYGKTFIECNGATKNELLAIIENKKDVPENLLKFYDITKNYCIQAFTSSKAYLTDVLKYKMVPGSNFKGCVPFV